MKPGAPTGAQGFRVNITSLPSTCGTQCPERTAAPAGVKGSVSQSQNTAVTLVTAEGDTVTLSSGSESQVQFETYNADGASVSSLSGEWSRSFSLSIEGDLNRKELRDIRKAVRTIEKVNRTLARGDADKAAEQAEKLQRLDTITSLDAELMRTRQVTLETWTGNTPAQPIEPPSQPEVPLDAAPDTIIVPAPIAAPDSDNEPTILQQLIESSATESVS
jgi:hypothetical protein